MNCTFDEKTHTYRINGVPVTSVTQSLKLVGIIDDRFYTEEAKERGKAVHAACHYLDEGDLAWDLLHPDIVPYVRAYLKFKKETGFVPLMIEKQVYNTTYMYAGTLDRVGMLGNREVLIDLKSGAVEPWAALQMAGYNECLPRRLPRFALQLKSNETYKLHKEFTDPNDRNTFLSVVAVVNWRSNNGGLKHGNEYSVAA